MNGGEIEVGLSDDMPTEAVASAPVQILQYLLMSRRCRKAVFLFLVEGSRLISSILELMAENAKISFVVLRRSFTTPSSAGTAHIFRKLLILGMATKSRGKLAKVSKSNTCNRKRPDRSAELRLSSHRGVFLLL